MADCGRRRVAACAPRFRCDQAGLGIAVGGRLAILAPRVCQVIGFIGIVVSVYRRDYSTALYLLVSVELMAFVLVCAKWLVQRPGRRQPLSPMRRRRFRRAMLSG